MEPRENPAVQYDEKFLFEFYCQHSGKIQDVKVSLRMLSTIERAQYPSEMTLYRYEKDFDWKERYKKVKEAVVRELDSKNAFNLQTMNRLAELALMGVRKRLTDALQRAMAGDTDALKAISPDLIRTLWMIQRTEQGLPTHFSKITNVEERMSAMDRAEQTLEEAGWGPIAEQMRKATPQVIQYLAELSGIDKYPTPAILRDD